MKKGRLLKVCEMVLTITGLCAVPRTTAACQSPMSCTYFLQRVMQRVPDLALALDHADDAVLRIWAKDLADTIHQKHWLLHASNTHLSMAQTRERFFRLLRRQRAQRQWQALVRWGQAVAVQQISASYALNYTQTPAQRLASLSQHATRHLQAIQHVCDLIDGLVKGGNYTHKGSALVGTLTDQALRVAYTTLAHAWQTFAQENKRFVDGLQNLGIQGLDLTVPSTLQAFGQPVPSVQALQKMSAWACQQVRQHYARVQSIVVLAGHDIDMPCLAVKDATDAIAQHIKQLQAFGASISDPRQRQVMHRLCLLHALRMGLEVCVPYPKMASRLYAVMTACADASGWHDMFAPLVQKADALTQWSHDLACFVRHLPRLFAQAERQGVEFDRYFEQMYTYYCQQWQDRAQTVVGMPEKAHDIQTINTANMDHNIDFSSFIKIMKKPIGIQDNEIFFSFRTDEPDRIDDQEQDHEVDLYKPRGAEHGEGQVLDGQLLGGGIQLHVPWPKDCRWIRDCLGQYDDVTVADFIASQRLHQRQALVHHIIQGAKSL